MIQATIDGRPIAVPEGTSILQAALGVGIDIPNLCYDETLSVAAACRLCSVEVEGRANLVAACATEVSDGMVVHTESEASGRGAPPHPRPAALRPPHRLPRLREGGRLPAAGVLLPLRRRDHELRRARSKSLEIDSVNALIERDQNKCILCGKCVRVCEEVQVDQRDRLRRPRLRRDGHRRRSTIRSTSRSAASAASASTSARRARSSTSSSRARRTWDRTKVRTTCPFCGVGCNFDLNVADGKVVGVTATYDAPVNQGSLCVKGRFHTDLIDSPDRITTPLIKKDGVVRGGHLGRGPRPGRPAAPRDPGRARRRRRRRAQLGALHQRRELPAAAAHAGGPQHEQHRSLRPYLTRSDGGRSGRHAGFRRDDQLDRRDRAATTCCSSSGPTPPRRTRSSATR